VAQRFAAELATHAAQDATRAIFLATIAFCALLAISLQAGAARFASPFSTRMLNILAPFAVQLVLTCAGLSIVRCWRHREDRAVTAGKLRWILRGDAVALGVILVGGLAELGGAVAGRPTGAPGWGYAVTAASGAVVLLALRASALMLGGRARTRALARFAGERAGPDDDALGDLLMLFAEARRWVQRQPRLAAPARVLDRASGVAIALAPRARWFSLRAHPWRLGVSVALLAGACAGVGHGISEGPPRLVDLPGAAAAFAVIGGMEGLAVIVCFALLGGFLGIRRPAPDIDEGSVS
jgi:hypothetical protein